MTCMRRPASASGAALMHEPTQNSDLATSRDVDSLGNVGPRLSGIAVFLSCLKLCSLHIRPLRFCVAGRAVDVSRATLAIVVFLSLLSSLT